jgi:hypothetical protein
MHNQPASSAPEPSYSSSVPDPVPQRSSYQPRDSYVEEEPPELTEKELAAAALFGGIPGATSGGRTMPKTQQGVVRKSSTSGSNSSATRRTTLTQPQRGNPRNPELSSRAPAPVPAPAPAPAPAPQNNLLDIMGDWGAPAPAPAPQQRAAPAQSNVLDPFGMQDLSAQISSFAPTSSPAQVGFSFSGQPISPLVISTPEFGRLWQEHKAETKLSVPQGSVRTLADLSSRLSTTFNLHPGGWKNILPSQLLFFFKI